MRIPEGNSGTGSTFCKKSSPTKAAVDSYRPSGEKTLAPLKRGDFLAAAKPPHRLDRFAGVGQQELDELYLAASAGPTPKGVSDGRAMFYPDCPCDEALSKVAKIVWQGKIFQPGENRVINRILGGEWAEAKLERGPSLLDGKESIIIDYGDGSLLLSPIRDEIREVEPGLYLGRAYVRTPLGNIMATNFALDFLSGGHGQKDQEN